MRVLKTTICSEYICGVPTRLDETAERSKLCVNGKIVLLNKSDSLLSVFCARASPAVVVVLR